MIPKNQGLIVFSSKSENETNLRVTELIDFDNACWDNVALASHFDEETVAVILTVPLSFRWPSDSLFWWLNKSGTYSVKSGYWLGLLSHNHEVDSTNVAALRKLSRVPKA